MLLNRLVLSNPPMRFENRDAEMMRQVELSQTSPVPPDSIRPSPSYVAPKVMYNWVLGPRSGAAEAGAEMLCFAHTLVPILSPRRPDGLGRNANEIGRHDNSPEPH